MAPKKRKTLSPGQVITFLSDIELNGNPLEFPDPPHKASDNPDTGGNGGMGADEEPHHVPQTLDSEPNAREEAPSLPNTDSPKPTGSERATHRALGPPSHSPPTLPPVAPPAALEMFVVGHAEASLFCHGRRAQFENVGLRIGCDQVMLGTGKLYLSKASEVWWMGCPNFAIHNNERANLPDAMNKVVSPTDNKLNFGWALRFPSAELMRASIDILENNSMDPTVKILFPEGPVIEFQFHQGGPKALEALGELFSRWQEGQGISSKPSPNPTARGKDLPNPCTPILSPTADSDNILKETTNESVDQLLGLESSSSDEDESMTSQTASKRRQRRRRSLVMPKGEAVPEESGEKTSTGMDILRQGNKADEDEVRSMLRIFTTLNPSSQEARRVAAWIFINEGYPLTTTAEKDAKVVLEVLKGISWEDPLQKLPGNVEFCDKSDGLSSYDQKKQLVMSLSHGLEKMEKARSLELKEVAERTHVTSLKVPGGYQYNEKDDGRKIQAAEYKKRYLAYVDWRMARHRERYPSPPWASHQWQENSSDLAESSDSEVEESKATNESTIEYQKIRDSGSPRAADSEEVCAGDATPEQGFDLPPPLNARPTEKTFPSVPSGAKPEVGSLYGGLNAQEFMAGKALQAHRQFVAEAEQGLFAAWDELLRKHHHKIVIHEATTVAALRIERLQIRQETERQQILGNDYSLPKIGNHTVQDIPPNMFQDEENINSSNRKYQQNSICELCCDEKVEVEIEPCGHQLCRSCTAKLKASTNEDESQLVCPWDRQQISCLKGFSNFSAHFKKYMEL